jgi:hypothetical protein
VRRRTAVSFSLAERLAQTSLDAMRACDASKAAVCYEDLVLGDEDPERTRCHPGKTIRVRQPAV